MNSKPIGKFDFYNQINQLRKNPSRYIPDIKQIIDHFIDQKSFHIGDRKFVSSQGKKVWLESINFLKQKKSSAEFQWSQGLYLAAKQYSNRIKQNNIQLKKSFEIQGDPFQIVQKYVNFSGEIKIWTSFGCSTIREFIKHAIVSDGDKSRSQRNSIFDEKFKYIGAYIANHKKFGNILIYYLAQKTSGKKNQKVTGQRLIQQINYLRKNPKNLIPNILHQIQLFKQNKLYLNEKQTLNTIEGKDAWIQCLQFLTKKLPVKQIQYKKQLNKVAIQKSKYPDVQFSKFIKLYSNCNGKASYIQNFGTKDPQKIVLSLLVSDGDKTRSSRNTIFNESFNYAGGFIDRTSCQQCSGILFVEHMNAIGSDSSLSCSLSKNNFLSRSMKSLEKFISFRKKKLTTKHKNSDNKTSCSKQKIEPMFRLTNISHIYSRSISQQNQKICRRRYTKQICQKMDDTNKN